MAQSKKKVFPYITPPKELSLSYMFFCFFLSSLAKYYASSL